LVSIWVNVGHAEHCVMNDPIDVIEKLANALYELNFFPSILTRCFLFVVSNRIAKEIAKVTDANDAVLDMFSMDESINAYQQININHVK
jgi:hypothetical protein